jgi:hypothetical protein
MWTVDWPVDWPVEHGAGEPNLFSDIEQGASQPITSVNGLGPAVLWRSRCFSPNREASSV